MQDEIEAALRALETAIVAGDVGCALGTDPHEATALRVTVLELCGTALRLDLPIPRPVRQWIAALSEPDLSAALHRAREPFGNELPTRVDEHFESAVQHRDMVESVVVAVRRVRRGDTWETPGFVELDEAMVRFDAHVRFWFGPNEITRALGPRRAMLWSGHWATKKVLRCL